MVASSATRPLAPPRSCQSSPGCFEPLPLHVVQLLLKRLTDAEVAEATASVLPDWCAAAAIVEVLRACALAPAREQLPAVFAAFGRQLACDERLSAENRWLALNRDRLRA